MEVKKPQNLSFKNLSITVRTYQEEKLASIAKREGLPLDSVIGYIFEMAISQYIKDHLEIKEKCFCNCCGGEYPKRKMHMVAAMYDQFVFCDRCFFGGEFKKFVYQIIG